MINLYDSKETSFNHNGIVVLNECISCNIPEELNGLFELELEYPLLDSVKSRVTITPTQIVGETIIGETEIHEKLAKWTYLLEGNIIKADGQLFRIYRKIKNLKSIKINARHIYYDLIDNFLEDVRPTNLSGAGALDYVLTHTQYAHTFTPMGDVGGSNTKYFVRKNPIEAIMGSDGIINTWGGELVRDNFIIKLLGDRGLDRGVLVSYGKNIQGIEETLDMDGLATRIMPLGKDALMISEKYIDSQYINNFPHPKVKVVEFTEIETELELRAAAQAYILNSKCDIPQFNYKIDFLELSKTDQYKKYAVLERVYLGDTVTIKHSKLNINLKAKVIKIIKNVLTKRIEKIELGSFKPNIATAINNSVNAVKQEIVQVKSDYQKAIDNATQLITGSKGGNVVIRQGEDGKPYEILIMDTTDVMTAENVWRWNLGGFGHSSTGVNGPYDTAITQDGSIVGNFIAANSISASKIKTEELIVGTNIAMGENARITWTNVDGKPIIPPEFTAGDVISTIESTYIDNFNVWTTNVYAENINTGEINGSTIKTSNALNHLHLQNQWLDYYNGGDRLMSMGHMQFSSNGQPLTGSLPVIAFGYLPKDGDLGVLNAMPALGTIFYDPVNGDLIFNNSFNGLYCGMKLGSNGKVSFSGTVDFTGTTVTGLGSDLPVIVKFI
jgi:phage minor structural protein